MAAADHARLAQHAQRVLDENRRGSWTCPSSQLYPHQWLWDSCFTAIGLACVDPMPDPLTDGVPVTGEMMSLPDEIRSYELDVSPWTFSEITVLPTGIGPMDPYVEYFLSGPVDRSAHEFGYGSTRVFSGAMSFSSRTNRCASATASFTA